MAESADYELLVQQFQRGDESAFETIVEQYSAEIALLANRLLGWPGDVEDVVQDTFLAAFLGLKKFRFQCSLRTWLFTITINKCRAHRYKRMLRLRRFSQADPKASSGSQRPADSAQMDSEAFEQVRRAVRALPATYREPIILTYLHGLAGDQVAQILGIKRNALQVRLNRARKRLKLNLADLMEDNL
jgi:RNA polymerase sigma factor (sigma-70 family)